MNDKTSIRSERSKPGKSTAEQDKTIRSARYNYTDMRKDTASYKSGFYRRLAELRMQSGKSGREMSLSLGQGAGYINNIENGKNLPSMALFFEICEYLNVSPGEFFSYTDEGSGRKMDLLIEKIRSMDPDDVDLMLFIVKRMLKERV